MKKKFLTIALISLYCLLISLDTISQTISFTNASWTSKTDVDGDGYRRSGILRLDLNSNQNFLGEIRIKYTKDNGSTLYLYYTTPSLLIITGGNYIELEIGTSATGGELSYGSYNF
jgi:hypothetical protein